MITGSLGLVWVVLWLLLLPLARPASARCPPRNASTSSRARRSICRGDGTRPSIGRILRQRNFWGIALPRFLADPTWGTLTFWLPLYLSTVRHFDLKQIALFAWMPFLAADFGCMFGGVVSLALQKHARPQPDQRAPRRVHASAPC